MAVAASCRRWADSEAPCLIVQSGLKSSVEAELDNFTTMPSSLSAAASMPSRLAFSARLAASSALDMAAVASSVAFWACSDFCHGFADVLFECCNHAPQESASFPVSSVVWTFRCSSRLPLETSSAKKLGGRKRTHNHPRYNDCHNNAKHGNDCRENGHNECGSGKAACRASGKLVGVGGGQFNHFYGVIVHFLEFRVPHLANLQIFLQGRQP